MYQRCMIAVFLGIFIIACGTSTPKTADQDPNVTPEGVRITPDIVYGHKFGMALTFDMYQPKNQNGAGLVFINSGGYQSVFPNYYERTTEGLRLVTEEALEKIRPDLRGYNIKPFLNKGIAVFAVRHGSSPKFEMPEIVADLRRAVRFIRFHASEYGIDPERLGLWGGSSGGHLSLLLGTTADIGNADANEEFEKRTGRVSAVVAYYPPSDLKRQVEFHKKKNPDILKQYPALDLEAEQYKEYSPLNFISSDDASTLIIHGDQDEGVPILEGESMHQALLKVGVKSKLVVIPGAGHGFAGKDAEFALMEMVSWFEEHLTKK